MKQLKNLLSWNWAWKRGHHRTFADLQEQQGITGTSRKVLEDVAWVFVKQLKGWVNRRNGKTTPGSIFFTPVQKGTIFVA